MLRSASLARLGGSQTYLQRQTLRFAGFAPKTLTVRATEIQGVHLAPRGLLRTAMELTMRATAIFCPHPLPPTHRLRAAHPALLHHRRAAVPPPVHRPIRHPAHLLAHPHRRRAATLLRARHHIPPPPPPPTLHPPLPPTPPPLPRPRRPPPPPPPSCARSASTEDTIPASPTCATPAPQTPTAKATASSRPAPTSRLPPRGVSRSLTADAYRA
jgi:hypothetical protein